MHTFWSTNKTGRKTGNLSVPHLVRIRTVGTQRYYNVETSQAASTLPQPGQDLCLSTTEIDSHDTCAEECSARLYIVIPSKATPGRRSSHLKQPLVVVPYHYLMTTRKHQGTYAHREWPDQPLPILLSGIITKPLLAPPPYFATAKKWQKWFEPHCAIEAFIPTLQDFTNSLECSGWSKTFMVSNNHDTLALPMKLNEPNLYFFHTPATPRLPPHKRTQRNWIQLKSILK